ncbi:MAG: hypothetical protein HYU56_02295 [Candidatus Aenigmarchaeota archaeon]|nr:hypothetical protein [Candidatus Aenigmarchaeota archaeon]
MTHTEIDVPHTGLAFLRVLRIIYGEKHTDIPADVRDDFCGRSYRASFYDGATAITKTGGRLKVSFDGDEKKAGQLEKYEKELNWQSRLSVR